MTVIDSVTRSGVIGVDLQKLADMYHQQGECSFEGESTAMPTEKQIQRACEDLCDKIKDAQVDASTEEGVHGVGSVEAIPKPLLAFLQMALTMFGPKIIEWLKAWIDKQLEEPVVVGE
jgi:hypothetical protein